MRALITGITGTLGTRVATLLLNQGVSVVGISRDERKQAQMAKHRDLTLYLGDIRDSARLLESARGVDLIFHFAALKHVDQLESNPEESIRTNIVGTENVLHAQRMLGISRVILSSTDKAVYPVNVYGMSKGIAEKLVLRNPRNIVCRYGNVLASRGSVVEALVKSLKERNEVRLTDPLMTRFWITPDDAASFVKAHGEAGVPGGLKIPTMKSATITQVASAVAATMNIPSYLTVTTGFRDGEKLHECLRTSSEGEEIHSNRAERFTDEELKESLRPIVRSLL